MGYIGRDNTLSTFTKQSITADGGTSFTLNQGVGDSSSILVSIGGIVQQPDVAYSASGTSLTFTSAPTNAYPIWVIYLGKELTVTNETATDNVDSQAGVGNGTATPITLVNSVPSAQSIIVTLNGIGQVPGTDFTVSGTALTFTTAPSAAMDILVYYISLSGTVNVPVDYSVSTASQFVASGTWPAWNGAALTNVGGDATQADIDGLIAALATLSFLQNIDHSTALLNFVNGWDDTFTVATSVDGEGRSIPKIHMDGQGNYALRKACSTVGFGTDGPQYLFSCIINFGDKADGTLVTICESSNARYLIERSTDNKLTVSISSSLASFGNLGRIKSTNNFVAADGDIYLQVAVNTATQTMQIVKNGVLETNVVTNTLAAGNILFNNGNYHIGGANFSPVNGFMAQYYHGLSFLDLSVQANREKFVTGTGASARAVDLGADGSIPTGSQPAIYLNNPFATWNVNLGSGGNFDYDQMVFVDGGYLDTDKLYSSDSFTNSYDLIHSHGKQFSAGGIGFTVGDHKKVGQCITLSSSSTISKLGFWVRRQGTLSGIITAEIHGLTGTPNSSAVSNNTILNVSNGIDSATTSTSEHFLLFTFPTPVTLPAGNYWVGINAFNMTGGGANYLSTSFGTSNDADGNAAKQASDGSWTGYAAHDVIYYLYGNTNLDLKTKGTDALTTVDSPASAPTKGHIEALVDERPASGTSVWSDTLTAESGGFGSTSYRQIVSGSNISTSGNRIRVRVEAPVAGTEGTGFDNIAIVERSGTSANGTTIPTEILFGGVSGVVATVGSQIWSDWTDFEIDQTKDYLLIADIAGSNSIDTGRVNASGGDGVYAMSSAPGNSYNTVGFTVTANHPGRTFLFNNLEVGVNPTINTHIIGELSRDGGTTWSPATLARSSTGIDGATSEILSGDVDFTGDPSGTNVVGRIRTVNKHKVTVDGISVNWS